jgi:hypothetical protein
MRPKRLYTHRTVPYGTPYRYSAPVHVILTVVRYRTEVKRLVFCTVPVAYRTQTYGTAVYRIVPYGTVPYRKNFTELIYVPFNKPNRYTVPYRTVQKLWRERPGREEGREEAGPEKAPALQIPGTNQRENQIVSEKP